MLAHNTLLTLSFLFFLPPQALSLLCLVHLKLDFSLSAGVSLSHLFLTSLPVSGSSLLRLLCQVREHLERVVQQHVDLCLATRGMLEATFVPEECGTYPVLL